MVIFIQIGGTLNTLGVFFNDSLIDEYLKFRMKYMLNFFLYGRLKNRIIGINEKVINFIIGIECLTIIIRSVFYE